jgi:Zn-dependent M28 family amino/carboxypeptidase
LIDRLFPRREGENIVGTVAPAGNIERRVIVSAHLDSAYEFKIWYWFKGFSVALMVVAFLAPLLLLAASLARTLAHSSGVPHGMPYFVLGIILIALAPVVGIFAFFHTSDVVPGAMDNMAGISVLAGLGKYLKEAAPEDKPKGSEVVLLATSSEEAGLRGAKRYVSKHKEDFTSVPTYGIFLDGICDENFLTVFTREVWPGARHDARLIELANSVASENGLSMKNGVLPVGATDAAAFSLAGVPSVALCCQDNSRLVPNYHTRLDTIDYVRPESMEVSLQIVIGMLNHLDTE